MIQRYSRGKMAKDDEGSFVLVADAEADKAKAVAEAVAKETADLRAELADALMVAFRSAAYYRDGKLGCDEDDPAMQTARRLETLGRLERSVSGTSGFAVYRPIESQSSGGRDE